MMANLAQFDLQAFFNSPFVPLLLFIIMAAGVLIITVVTVQWRRVRIAEADATIKARMIERGFSATEIAQVLNAGSPQGRPRKHERHANVCCT